MQLTHAAAVGSGDGAVLLVGGAGAGKSTASLSCLLAGFEFFGDDYCLVDPGPPATVHAVYTTAKLRPDALERLPELRNVVRNASRLDQQKAILDLADAYGERLGTSAPLKAIVAPQVAGRFSCRPASPGAALRALAPSTVFGLFGATPQTLPRLAQVVRDVPGFVLELGDDVDEVAAQVMKLADAA